MTDGASPTRSVDSSLVRSVALGLETLHQHEDRAEQIPLLVQQISLARKELDGPVAELLWATENFLSSISSGTLNDKKGSLVVLRDLSRYLHRIATDDRAPSIATVEVDELLERLDFLASGGDDRDVPKSDSVLSPSPGESTATTFPIEPSPLDEDPILASAIERARSTYRLIVSSLTTREARQSLDLAKQQLGLLEAIEEQTNERTYISLAEFSVHLNESICSESENTPKLHQTDVTEANSREVHLYRSLANFLGPVVQAFAKTLQSAAANHPDASFEFHTVAKADQLTIAYELRGIEVKTATHVVATIGNYAKDHLAKSASPKFPSAYDTGTSPDLIGPSSLTFVEAVQFLAGSVHVENPQPGAVTIESTISRSTRITPIVPFTIGSNQYALEAHLVRAVIPSRTANSDIYRNLVFHEGVPYEYTTLRLSPKLSKIGSDSEGFMILTDCISQDLAIHVDEVQEIELMAIRQSSSDVEFGSTLSLSSPKLLLDLQAFAAEALHDPTQKASPSFGRVCICLCDVTDQLADTFAKATEDRDIECISTRGRFDAIRSIQERKPRILVTQSPNNDGLSHEEFLLLEHYTDLSQVLVLIATSDKETQRPKDVGDPIELHWISEKIHVDELKQWLAKNLSSEEFSKSTWPD